MRAPVAGLLLMLALVAACAGAVREPVAARPSPPPPAPPAVQHPVEPPPPVSQPVPQPAAVAIYAGVWSGTWIVRECIESGGAVGAACRSIPQRERLQLRLAQSGTQIEGVLELGFARADVAGAVGDDGTLVMSGRRNADTHTVTVLGWQSDAAGGQMAGAFSYSIEPQDPRLGVVTVTAVLDTVVRVD